MDAEKHQIYPVCAKRSRKTYRLRQKTALVLTHPFYTYSSLLVYFTFNNEFITSLSPYSILVYMQLIDKNYFGEAAITLVIPRAIHHLWICGSVDKSLAAVWRLIKKPHFSKRRIRVKKMFCHITSLRFQGNINKSDQFQ